MQQHLIKLRHMVKVDKTISKKPEVALISAETYTDAETQATKWIEEEKFANPTDMVISKIQNHEILGYGPKSAEDDKQWYKSRVRYVSESDKGKISYFYARYLVYADDIEKALALIIKKEESSAVQGEIENIVGTKIDYMLVPRNQFAIPE